jgi:hypothetical protein
MERVQKFLSTSTGKYFKNLIIFILLYKAGEFAFNYFERNGLFPAIVDSIYHFLSLVITTVSVRFYALFYADISSDSGFLITIHKVRTIQMMHGCTGLMQLFQALVILLFFPLSIKKKLLFLPISFLVILFASIVHYIILIPVA